MFRDSRGSDLRLSTTKGVVYAGFSKMVSLFLQVGIVILAASLVLTALYVVLWPRIDVYYEKDYGDSGMATGRKKAN